MVGAYVHEYEQDQIEGLTLWLQELRSTPELMHCIFVIVSEINYGTLSIDIAVKMRGRLSNYVVFDANISCEKTSFGLHTDNRSKYLWTKEFRVTIFCNNIIYIWRRAVIDAPRLENDVEKLWSEYITQMDNFVEIPPPIKPLARGQRRGLPQLTGKSHGIRDDLVDCTIFFPPLLRVRCDPEAWGLIISALNPNYCPPQGTKIHRPTISQTEQNAIMQRALYRGANLRNLQINN